MSRFWSTSNPLIFDEKSHQLRFGESVELENSHCVSFAGGQVVACSFLGGDPFGFLAVYSHPGDLKAVESNAFKQPGGSKAVESNSFKQPGGSKAVAGGNNIQIGLLQIYALNDQMKTSMFCAISVDGCPIWDIKRCAGVGVSCKEVVGPFAVATNKNGILIYW